MNTHTKKEEAIAIFDNYPELETIFITSDLQGFTEENKAENHAQSLPEKSIDTFHRSQVLGLLIDENPDENSDKNSDENDLADNQLPNADRQTLLDQYETFFGKPAPHNISDEKLLAKINEKQSEISED